MAHHQGDALSPSDRLVERLYDVVFSQTTEYRRTELARAALIAAEYRQSKLRPPRPPQPGKEPDHDD